MEYSMTWSDLDTPAGRRYCLLRASGRRISGQGFSGWPSPIVNESDYAYDTRNHNQPILKLSGVAKLAGWPSPNTPSGGRSVSTDKMDATGKTADGRKHTASLEHAVKFAGWPSPAAHDGHREAEDDSSTQGTNLRRDVRKWLAGWPTPKEQNSRGVSPKRDSLNSVVELTGWNTPRSTDGEKGGPNQGGGALSHDATLAGWATPTSRDDKDTGTLENVPVNALLGRQARLSGARTGNGEGYRLNPGFSLWLMTGDSIIRGMIRNCPRGLVRSRSRET